MNFYKILKLAHIDIKSIIKNDQFFINLFNKYDVPMQKLNQLNIKFIKMDKNAKSIQNDIYLNQNLDKEDIPHVLSHQICHFLNRQRQKMCYLSDPQQIEAFTVGIAKAVEQNKSLNQIKKFYLPIFQKHYKNKKQALNLFLKLYDQAVKVNKKL